MSGNRRSITGLFLLSAAPRVWAVRRQCSFKKAFPEAEITLYYGASELNYITYIRGSEMRKKIRRWLAVHFQRWMSGLKMDHFHVKTRYGILGIGNDAVIGGLRSHRCRGTLLF